jgi:hypothetical protein
MSTCDRRIWVVMAYRNLAQEPEHIEYVMSQKVVERKHVRLLNTKEDIVCQVLDDFGNEKQSSTHFLGWRSRHQALNIWSNNGRAEETQENEGSNSRVLCIGEPRLNSICNLQVVSLLFPFSLEKKRKRKRNRKRWHFRLTILQILRNEGGMFVTDAQMSSMKTFATMRSCRAFLRDSSTPLTRAGSSSRSRSSDVSMSLSMTFWSVSLRYRAPFHFPYTESILVATDVRRSSSDSFSASS